MKARDMAKKNNDSVGPSNQLDKFKEAARELETDDREEAFDEKLKRVAKPVPAQPVDKHRS